MVHPIHDAACGRTQVTRRWRTHVLVHRVMVLSTQPRKAYHSLHVHFSQILPQGSVVCSSLVSRALVLDVSVDFEETHRVRS